MLIRLAPLQKYRDFRLLFVSQIVSFLGSMISYVAIPYQIHQLTKSPLMVGLLGTVQLIPVLVFGLVGGNVADSMDRRKLLLISEAVMSLGTLALAANAAVASPNVTLIFVLAALIQSASAFHRPAMDAMNQKLVAVEDLPAVSALGSFRYSVGSVVGPALGGVLIANAGATIAYLVDFATFIFAMILIWMMRTMPKPDPGAASGAARIMEGLRYALKRPELIGTYVVDIVAMTFAFCTALFPMMAENWGGPTAAGAMFSAMSAGSLLLTLFSGWTSKVSRHGAAVIIAAGIWGIATIAFGYAPNLSVALVLLGVAGAADMVSGLFRGIIWNETIPNEMRGRMAGIEMISYMSGPLLGNARAGWVASVSGAQFSIISGGLTCVIGVVACAFVLPRFWAYVSVVKRDPSAV